MLLFYYRNKRNKDSSSLQAPGKNFTLPQKILYSERKVVLAVLYHITSPLSTVLSILETHFLSDPSISLQTQLSFFFSNDP